MVQPIEVHYFPTMNGWKVAIALEEMELPYVLKCVDIRRGDQYDPAFLKISPNNRMPAIVDPDGPDGAPISVFESGAILLYLARKSGKFYPQAPRARVEVEQWLMWQMGGLGPMTGQLGHFHTYAPLLVDDPGQITYSYKRYHDEVARLFGVLDRRLADREFLAGDYSIADMAAWPWTVGHPILGFDLAEFPNMKRWFETLAARPAVQRGRAAGAEFGQQTSEITEAEKKASLAALFGHDQAKLA